MSTLVSQNPNPGSEQALDNSVESPQRDTCRVRRDRLRGDIVVEDVENGGKDRDIPEDVVQAGHSGALEAVGGNGISDILDGVIGDLELVSVGVEHLAIVLLFSVRNH